MALKDEFAENSGIIVDGQTTGINIEQFKAFVEKNGNEQAKGYLQALVDMESKLTNIIFITEEDGSSWCVTPHMVRKNVANFHDQLSEFLESFKTGNSPLLPILSPQT